MSFPAALASAILDTILSRLAPLFLTGTAGDANAARQAARQMLASYSVATADELRLAAEVIAFSFHALNALGQAAEPELSLNRVLRLRGSAVSLSREAHKSQRKLDQLQRARAMRPPAESGTWIDVVQPEPARPRDEDGREGSSTEAERVATKTAAKIWLQSYNKREAAERITKNLKLNQAGYAERHSAGIAGAYDMQPAA